MTGDHQQPLIEGGCLCGAIRYQIRAVPRRTTHCHCIHCRRTSGAAFMTWSEIDSAAFRIISGSPSRHECRPQVFRQFCAQCGGHLTYTRAGEPETIDVATCSLDHPEAAKPDDHVWCDRILPWVKLNDGLPKYGRGRQDG